MAGARWLELFASGSVPTRGARLSGGFAGGRGWARAVGVMGGSCVGFLRPFDAGGLFSAPILSGFSFALYLVVVRSFDGGSAGADGGGAARWWAGWMEGLVEGGWGDGEAGDLQ